MWRLDEPGSPAPGEALAPIDEQRAVYRACMIEWLDSVHEALGVSLATFSHAVVLMDRFMRTEHARVDRYAGRLCAAQAVEPAFGAGPHAHGELPPSEAELEAEAEACAPADGEAECLPLVSDEQLQLVAMTCLLVAAKLVEDEPPAELDSLQRFCDLAGHGRYHWTELRSMEAALCGRLRWQLGAPCPLGELRELVLRAGGGVHSAARGGGRGGLAGSDGGEHAGCTSSEEEEEEERCCEGITPRAPRAASGRALGPLEASAYGQLHSCARLLSRQARADAEVGSFLLQACLYSSAGLFDRVAPDVLAEAALRAAQSHAAASVDARAHTGGCGQLSSCRSDGSASDGGSSDGGDSLASTHLATPGSAHRARSEAAHAAAGPREACVARLGASLGLLLAGPFRGASVLGGLKPLAGAEANRWEFPRCLASKRRFAAPRPTAAAAVAWQWCGRGSRQLWPLYALHDAHGTHAAPPRAPPGSTAEGARAPPRAALFSSTEGAAGAQAEGERAHRSGSRSAPCRSRGRACAARSAGARLAGRARAAELACTSAGSDASPPPCQTFYACDDGLGGREGSGSEAEGGEDGRGSDGAGGRAQRDEAPSSPFFVLDDVDCAQRASSPDVSLQSARQSPLGGARPLQERCRPALAELSPRPRPEAAEAARGRTGVQPQPSRLTEASSTPGRIPLCVRSLSRDSDASFASTALVSPPLSGQPSAPPHGEGGSAGAAAHKGVSRWFLRTRERYAARRDEEPDVRPSWPTQS